MSGSDFEFGSLQAASIEDLIDEIEGRFDHCVFAGVIVPADEEQIVHKSSKGNRLTCEGLAYHVARHIDQRLVREAEEE